MATREHCTHAFDALLGHLRGLACPPPTFPTEGREFPMFVTWSKRGGGSSDAAPPPDDSSSLEGVLQSGWLADKFREHERRLAAQPRPDSFFW